MVGRKEVGMGLQEALRRGCWKYYVCPEKFLLFVQSFQCWKARQPNVREIEWVLSCESEVASHVLVITSVTILQHKTQLNIWGRIRMETRFSILKWLYS